MKKYLFIPVIGLVLFAFVLPKGGYQLGDKVSDFSLKNIDGRMVSLASYPDVKGYILVFTCNSCPYSVAYEDRIIALHHKYNKLGYPVIAINPNDAQKSPSDSFDQMQVRAKEKDFPFAYLYDESQEVTKTFGATNTPHVYILNQDLEVKYIGAIDNNTRDAAAADKKYIEDALKALINLEEVAIPKTKAIGCTIKWAS